MTRRGIVAVTDGGSVQLLPAQGARRLSNQITRACRGTYGARTGLRAIVRGLARQMIGAGWSAEEVARALEESVLNHPACVADDPRSIATGKLNSRMLIEIAQECVADVALE